MNHVRNERIMTLTDKGLTRLAVAKQMSVEGFKNVTINVVVGVLRYHTKSNDLSFEQRTERHMGAARA